MELRDIFRQQKNNKFHPSWIVTLIALSILVGGIVWTISWLVGYMDRTSDRMPGMTPDAHKVIMVAKAGNLT